MAQWVKKWYTDLVFSVSVVAVIGGIVYFVNYYSIIGFSAFTKDNAIAIFSSVIQGMSALLSIAIAVIIFRTQSLENRNQSLEQSTLNYIYNITHWTYPRWESSVEDDITSGRITERYSQLLSTNEKERNLQQTRLVETIGKLHATEEKIGRIRRSAILNTSFLLYPIAASLLFLLVSDAFSVLANFVAATIIIGLSAIGVLLLLRVVAVSL